MPLTPAILAPQLIAASGATDPVSIAGWTAIASVWDIWTIGSVTVNAVLGTPLIAVGPVITGTGGLVAVGAPLLGPLLAAACGAVDPTSIAKWTTVAIEYGRWLMASGQVNPITLVAYTGVTPPTGPVSGTATLQFPDIPLFAQVLGITDAVAGAHWVAVAKAIANHLALALMTPSMTNPGVGGPVVGTGTIS